MGFRDFRSNSQIPTPFPHRFPVNSHALTSVEGLLGQDENDAAIQTTSTSKAIGESISVVAGPCIDRIRADRDHR